MSRVPRSQEHLKTGFASEAASAARFRAYARSAEADGLAGLAARFLELAEAKDALAILQLEASGQVRSPERSVADALAEERYENDVLYPKMVRDCGASSAETAEIFHQVVAEQQEHLRRLEELRSSLQMAAGGDVQ